MNGSSISGEPKSIHNQLTPSVLQALLVKVRIFQQTPSVMLSKTVSLPITGLANQYVPFEAFVLAARWKKTTAASNDCPPSNNTLASHKLRGPPRRRSLPFHQPANVFPSSLKALHSSFPIVAPFVKGCSWASPPGIKIGPTPQVDTSTL